MKLMMTTIVADNNYNCVHCLHDYQFFFAAFILFIFLLIKSVPRKKNHLFTYSLTYLLTSFLTPWCRVLLEKLTGLQLVKKFPAFHGTRRFITALTRVRHLSLSWASPIQSIYPHTTSWRSILILSTHLRLGLPIGLLPSGFPTKTLYTPSPHPYGPHAHLILLDFITRTILGEEYKSFISLLCNVLGPCHHGMVRPRVVDGGSASSMEGSCK